MSLPSSGVCGSSLLLQSERLCGTLSILFDYHTLWGEMEQVYKGLLISISGQALQQDVRGKYSWVLYSLILVAGIALFCKLLWLEMCPEG